MENLLIIPEDNSRFSITLFTNSEIGYDDIFYYYEADKVIRFNCSYSEYHDFIEYKESLAVNRIKRFLDDIKHGIINRFPICCIIMFSLHSLLRVKYHDKINSHLGLNSYGINYRKCCLHR
jgi:hypothetical protein